jgi:hypothetical protein
VYRAPDGSEGIESGDEDKTELAMLEGKKASCPVVVVDENIEVPMEGVEKRLMIMPDDPSTETPSSTSPSGICMSIDAGVDVPALVLVMLLSRDRLVGRATDDRD